MKLPLVVLFAATAALGSEQPLGFTHTGPTVATGVTEVYGTTTPRFGRPTEYFKLENRVGFGYGFTPTVEAQALMRIDIESAGLEGRAAEGGGEARLRWLPLDGRRDVFGFGLEAAVGVTTVAVSAEARLMLEKWFGDLLVALNASVDYAIRNDGAAGPDLHTEQTGGLAYKMFNGVTAGFEVRSRVGFERSTYAGAAVYLGPVIGWRGKSAWLTVAFLPQVAAVKAQAQVGNGEALELRDNERVVMRLMAGVTV